MPLETGDINTFESLYPDMMCKFLKVIFGIRLINLDSSIVVWNKMYVY